MLVSAVVANAEPAARPNILWVVTEDDTADFVGAYGDPLARTPTFDRLAREGVLFERAYAAAPVCAPSRASLITGMYATSLGLQHMRSKAAVPEWLHFYPYYLRQAGYFTTNAEKTDYNTDVLPGTWDQNGKQAHWRNRKPGQPFFSVFNFAASHESRVHVRKPLRTDPAKVRVPAYLPDIPEAREDIAQYFDCVAEADRQITALLEELKADGLEEDTIIFYYGDNGGVLPRSKRFMYENGTHIPLVIRFPKKFQHLAPAPAGSRSQELVNLLDLGPTVISLAGGKVPEFMHGRAIAGEGRKPAPPYAYTFRDRMDERYDLSRAVNDGRFRYIRNYRPELPAGQRLDYLWRQASMAKWEKLWREGKLNEAQSAFFLPRAPEELFDLEKDPDNVRNLAGDPAYQQDLTRLRAANREHVIATRDLGFFPESLLQARSKGKAPWYLADDKALYPLADIVAFVDNAQLSAEPRQDLVQAAVAHHSPVMRFWAAIAARRIPDGDKLVGPLVRDSEPSVAVAAAGTVLRVREDADAIAALDRALRAGPNMETRLEAANVLANLPKWPEALRPALQAAKSGDASTEPGVATLCEALLTGAR